MNPNEAALAKAVPNPGYDLAKSGGANAVQAAVKAGTIRNLSAERRKAHLSQCMRQELNGVNEFEAVVINVPERDAKGAMKLDKEGFPVLIEKKVRKVDVIRKRWEAKINAAELSL